MAPQSVDPRVFRLFAAFAAATLPDREIVQNASDEPGSQVRTMPTVTPIACTRRKSLLATLGDPWLPGARSRHKPWVADMIAPARARYAMLPGPHRQSATDTPR